MSDAGERGALVGRGRRSCRRLGAGMLLGAALLGCGSTTVEPAQPGAASAPVSEAAAAPSHASEASAFFPRTDFAHLHYGTWGRHTALIADGRVYASNGEDLPAMISSAMLAILTQEPTDPRCGVIGLGAGVEATALRRLGCSRVIVFERRADELAPMASKIREWVELEHVELRTEAPVEQFNVLVQSMPSTLLSRPHRLFTVERFRALGAQLYEGGVLAQHVPAYHLHQRTHRRMLRTIAEAFPHVAVLDADQDGLVADTVVLASDSPIHIDLDRAGELLGGIRSRWLERTGATAATELTERVVLADRDEVLSYCAGAQPYTAAEPMSLHEIPLRPASGPNIDQDPREQARFEAALEDHARQFEVFADELERPGSGWGRACRERPSRCPLFSRP